MRQLGTMLRDLGWSLAVAESCTGGLVSAWITDVPGASAYFVGGVVAYADTVKQTVLRVPAMTLELHGAVSSACAEAMARGVREALSADVGLATTGIAGPGGATAEKPVGLVYVAADCCGGPVGTRELRLKGSREKIRHAATESVLRLARELLEARDR